MRALLLATCLSLVSTAAMAQSDPAAPIGKLSDAARPTAYRLDLTILPDQPRFSGHAEIDAMVKAQTSRLYIHGRDLAVTRAVARIGGKSVTATYTQVDPTGVVRLDFASPVPAGAITLAFDYDAPFGDNPSGVYHIKVGDDWYSWSQFESIDARAAFPAFDEPGFKTPFTVSITTRPGLKTVSNAPEIGVTKLGTLEKHSFQPTRPLPTYLLALMTGPFITADGAIAANVHRATPLPLRIVATRAQAGKLDYALAETKPIINLLEEYFGQPFPFPKLDQIGSPVMPGAMENAGADTYADPIILLDAGATTRQKQSFGMVVAHELSHQWFGDLVTPAWWDDIWLNESFANWMGYRIGDAWKPELNIGVGALAEGFRAMNTDALEIGRPIHQPITSNGQIDSAFDGITYGKGGQVVAMIAAYLGDEKFKAGVRLHLSRHMYGNASSEQFFSSLADAAKDPRVLAALRSFVDQQGVPVIDVKRAGPGKLTISQSRYAFYGSKPAPESWTIPLCLRQGTARNCTLLDQPSATIAMTGTGAIVPNAGGAGYYRFNLSPADWAALIAEGPRLPAGEAIATNDSLWAAFRAGKADAATLIAAARTMAANPDSNVSIDGGNRLSGLHLRGLITEASLPDYRRVMASIYTPRLAAIGFDPAAGAHAADAPDKQKLRQDLVGLVANEAEDKGVRAKLAKAGSMYLAGDTKALDQAFLGDALGVVVTEGGLPAAKSLMERALKSEDPIFRGSALDAIASTGKADIANWLLAYGDPRLRTIERFGMVATLASTAATRDMAGDWILANYDALAKGNGIFVTSRLPQALSYQCSADRAHNIATLLGPKVKKLGQGELDFARTVESIGHCGALREAKAVEIAAALKAAR